MMLLRYQLSKKYLFVGTGAWSKYQLFKKNHFLELMTHILNLIKEYNVPLVFKNNTQNVKAFKNTVSKKASKYDSHESHNMRSKSELLQSNARTVALEQHSITHIN